MPGEDLVDDSVLVGRIRDELESADIIVSWNGILHDIPLLNARLQFAGLRPYKAKVWPNGTHLDLMYYAGGQSLKVGGKRLDTIARFFGLTQKTPLDGKTWQRAGVGDRASMDDVVEHCEHDTVILREVFPILAPHIKKLQLPISYWYKWADKINLEG